MYFKEFRAALGMKSLKLGEVVLVRRLKGERIMYFMLG